MHPVQVPSYNGNKLVGMVCPICGAASTAALTIFRAIRDWNEMNPLPAPAGVFLVSDYV